jgi:hypothetical protein
MAASYSTDSTRNKQGSESSAAKSPGRWRKIIASKPRSQSSSNVESQICSRQSSDMAQKHGDILGESPWPAYTTQTSVSVDKSAQNQQTPAPGIHRRLCFSLDEKALFDLHHPQYSSTSSQQQSSPHRISVEPMKPPFEPPERVRTPDGVPSWPGVTEACRHPEHHVQAHQATPGRRAQLSGIFNRVLPPYRNNDSNGKRARLRRVLSFKRRREEPQRLVTQWRPPISGHSTYRFGA